MFSTRKFQKILLMVCCQSLLACHQILLAGDATFNRPVAVASNGAFGFIGNHRGSAITVIDSQSLESRSIQGDWQGLVDLGLVPASNRLLVITQSPPQIVDIDADSTHSKGSRPMALPGIPAKLAISMDSQFACISMTWKHSVCIVKLVEGRLPDESRSENISLGFQPKEVLTLANGMFLIADAFGGQLAVIDAGSAKIVATHRILGHHIGGLARDDSQQTIAITHQKLSIVAQTTRDDIHWGTLIQNLVSVVPESQLLDPNANITRSVQKIPLGEVDNGAADPSGIVAWDGHVAIAVSGTNQLAFRADSKSLVHYKEVERLPTRVSRFGDSKIMSINTLSNTVSIFDWRGDRLQLVGELGTSRTLDTNEDRGEAAFFSASLSHDGWMSCNSCHVEVHTPDLLTDTMGDGRFGNPKRIPSLFNVAETGPWTWNGRENNLEGQIEKTLNSTMHRDPSSRENGLSDSIVATDIAAFLRKQKMAKEIPVASEKLSHGQILFKTRGCVRCHRPEMHYTSPETYDVGVVDEAGESQFNPPSLEGLAHRRAYFHDARFKSIADLLRSHPEPTASWTSDEISAMELLLGSL